MPIRVLIVEHSETTRDAFVSALLGAGMDAYAAKTIPEAAELIAKRGAHVVVLDLLAAPEIAFLFLGGVLGAMPNTRVIATTASGAMRQASMAVGEGAFDYLVKPVDAKRLISTVKNAYDGVFQSEHSNDPYAKAMFGDAFETVVRMAPSTAPILIEGEPGTGKQDCAVFMHSKSHRAKLPFVSRACSSFTGTKLEQLFSQALLRQGGTLFLQDANKLSLRVQTQLLRFLQSSVFDGSPADPQLVKVRVVLGISSSLDAEVDAGRLREDLFYRLKAVRIWLAPLRDRSADIGDIADAMIKRIGQDAGQPEKSLAEDAISILARTNWTENHAELYQTLDDAMKTSRSKTLRAESLPDRVLKAFVDATGSKSPVTTGAFSDNANSSLADLLNADWSLADLERLVIELAISQNNGSVPKAAKQLKVSPSTLYRKREAWLEKDL